MVLLCSRFLIVSSLDPSNSFHSRGESSNSMISAAMLLLIASKFFVNGLPYLPESSRYSYQSVGERRFCGIS